LLKCLHSSDFLEASFTIYDAPAGAKPTSDRTSRRFASKQISPQVPAGNVEAGNISYKKFSLLKPKRPRRMICSLKSPASSICESSDSKSFDNHKMHCKEQATSSAYTILKNKAPMWNEQLECWFLNFHERKDMTVASVKNFQLVATVDQSQPGGRGDEETVLLQFCKVGGDTFTMYYRQPLSAFHAFAICLTSFGTKLACQ
jgi:tubby and related proteins